MDEISSVADFCICVVRGESLVCLLVVEVFLENLSNEVFVFKDADPHVFVCFDDDEFWVVDEFSECEIFVDGDDVLLAVIFRTLQVVL